jgi:light-regulated signal transduction histidine kinase (bacteriophytochrome)
VRGLIAKAYESRGGIDFGTENLTKAGKRLICEWRSNVLYGADGEFVAIMHMAIDMTEVIESLEARVAQRTAELSATVRELELFSYTVAHDLRAPLRALDGYSYLLAEGGPNAPKFLERIRSNVAHMSSLIDGLLHYGRLGRQSINRQSINMGRLVETVVGDLKQSYPAVQIEVAPLPSTFGDESMIRQVWTNLIGNACKFSSQSAGARVRVWCEARDNGKLRYFVADNGVGFDMAYASRLFGVFERLHKQNEFAGSGIGLSIVKRVVERHGGSVGVDSTPGAGATFWFELPGMAGEESQAG